MASNRSPSPVSTRISRNSEMNPTRRSINGNPFARPTTLANPRTLNPPTPANSPAITDHMKRHSIGRKSMDNSMFQDGKENHKDALRSPAKGGSKNFMAPTISAASKFTPSPRKKVLGEKNEVTRTSVQFLDQVQQSDLKSEAVPMDQTLEKKEVVLETSLVHEVNFSSDATEMLCENSDLVNVVESCPNLRPFCCSPQTSPIISPLDADPSLPPYDPKKNFLSPRPRFLRYKPNPRIEILLKEVDGNDDDDVTTSFNLSENSSEAEEEQEEQKEEEEGLLGDSSEDLSEMATGEKQSDSKAIKASKPPFFTRSKTICLLSLMFLIGCFLVSFTDSPPMDLPIYKEISFPEIYDESLKIAASAKESFHGFVENLKRWSTPKISSVQFYNLTFSPLQEEFTLDRHIGADCIQAVEEEMEDETDMVYEEAYEEMEVEEENEIEAHDDYLMQESLKAEVDEANEIEGHDDYLVQESLKLEDDESSETASEGAKPETLSSYSTMSITTTVSLACLSMAILAVLFKNTRKAKAGMGVADGSIRRESCSSAVNSYQKVHKKKNSNNKRESLDLSMGSYGSYTTYERIPIKDGEEVMVTPIRRSSRLMKSQSQVTCS